MSLTNNAEGPLPPGSVTFLFTDIEGSASLWERYPDSMREALARHDALLRHAVESCHGRVVKTTGDGALAVFSAPSDAIAACVAAQQALQALDVDLARPTVDVSATEARPVLRVRMGLHTGVAELRANDYFGNAPNRAARIMSVAHGGQILLSETTAALVRNRLPARVSLREMGEFSLRGLLQPERLLQVVAPELRADFPLLLSLNANSLPAERDTFVGRREVLAELARRVDRGARLVSVIGTAGTGKTRLVTRFGWDSLRQFAGGVWFCDLSQARGIDGVIDAVAQGLGVPLGKAEPVTQVGRAIMGRGRCLIILDNFEQVVDQAPATLGRWLDQASDATFVATSRERLHLPGEEVFPIEPLALATEAIELFATRAKTHKSDFVLSDSRRSEVAEIVRLLDGLPLAIELAAARIAVLSTAQLVERMQNRFRLLTGARGVAARQSTLRAAIDWSWDLLSPWEQAALAQCSVFEGGFTLTAAEAIIDLDHWPQSPSAMDVVNALVDKSLLRAWVPVEQSRYDIDEPYFGMYLSVHEYAEEKLGATGPERERAAQERHGRYYAGFGTDEAVESLFVHGGIGRLRALGLELDNLVAACRRAIQRGDAVTAVETFRAAWEVIELRGPFALGVELGAQISAMPGLTGRPRDAADETRAVASIALGRADEAHTLLEQVRVRVREAGDRSAEGRVLAILASLAREQGRMEQARAYFGEAIAMLRELGHRRLEGKTLGRLASLDTEQGRAEEARVGYEAALAIAREVGSRRDEASSIANLGMLLQHRARIEEARSNYEAAIAIMREIGSRRDEGVGISNLAILLHDQGRLDESREQYTLALAIHRELGHRREEGIALGNLASLELAQGRFEQAQEHFEIALAIAHEVGHRRHAGFLLESLGGLHLQRGRLDDSQSSYEQALAISRDVGNRRSEALVTSGLGEILERQGMIAQAREAVRASEALLRLLALPQDVAKVLCIRGRIDVACKDPAAALAALAEAESVAQSMSAGAESDLGQKIARLRREIDPTTKTPEG